MSLSRIAYIGTTLANSGKNATALFLFWNEKM